MSIMRLVLLLPLTRADEDGSRAQSDLYAAALRKAGKDFEYYSYADEGHGLADAAHIEDFLNRLDAFLKRHNPAE
jgi:dipeptidyl aminopeptidase/acylaminoacyl peptidase